MKKTLVAFATSVAILLGGQMGSGNEVVNETTQKVEVESVQKKENSNIEKVSEIEFIDVQENINEGTITLVTPTTNLVFEKSKVTVYYMDNNKNLSFMEDESKNKVRFVNRMIEGNWVKDNVHIKVTKELETKFKNMGL